MRERSVHFCTPRARRHVAKAASTHPRRRPSRGEPAKRPSANRGSGDPAAHAAVWICPSFHWPAPPRRHKRCQLARCRRDACAVARTHIGVKTPCAGRIPTRGHGSCRRKRRHHVAVQARGSVRKPRTRRRRGHRQRQGAPRRQGAHREVEGGGSASAESGRAVAGGKHAMLSCPSQPSCMPAALEQCGSCRSETTSGRVRRVNEIAHQVEFACMHQPRPQEARRLSDRLDTAQCPRPVRTRDEVWPCRTEALVESSLVIHPGMGRRTMRIRRRRYATRASIASTCRRSGRGGRQRASLRRHAADTEPVFENRGRRLRATARGRTARQARSRRVICRSRACSARLAEREERHRIDASCGVLMQAQVLWSCGKGGHFDREQRGLSPVPGCRRRVRWRLGSVHGEHALAPDGRYPARPHQPSGRPSATCS